MHQAQQSERHSKMPGESVESSSSSPKSLGGPGEHLSSRAIRTGVNVYSRNSNHSPNCVQNANAATVESPRKHSLFGSLRLGKVRRESKDSPNQSPVGSIDQDTYVPCEVPSPRKLSGLFWESFRPRSKSDSRPRRASTGSRSSVNAPAGWPPPMTSIPSTDEECAASPPKQKPERVVKPLFVDTTLANRATNSPGSVKSPRISPITNVVNRISIGRRRSLSGNAKNEENRMRSHERVPSGPAAGGDSFFQNDDVVYSQFMKTHKCYDLIPTSTKLAVFDIQLSVKKAFFALVYNGIRAAPLWDGTTQRFVGMLTVTDFIHILHRYYQVGVSGIKELEEHKIASWREVLLKDGLLKPFITVDVNESLFKAVQLLCECKVHRLPIVDGTTGNILYILTHKRILRFLYLYVYDLPRPAFLDKTPKELGIGSWGSILTVKQHTTLVEALRLFLENRVSALPVLDEHGRVVDIYAKFDALNLAADKSYNKLDVTVQEALKHRSEWFEGVRSCKLTDSLATVLETLVKAEVHRVLILDDDTHVTGMVSLSDILAFLVLRPSYE